MIKAAFIKKILPRCPDAQAWADALNPALSKYSINTKNRICAFLAQTAYESGQYNIMVENLNYRTAARLMEVWPRRFPSKEFAEQYLQNPKKLGNYVYANRLGNGDSASGDGFKYRGRGIIQITGRSNYAALGKELEQDFISNPEKLETIKYAALSAAWFWEFRGLNALADDETGNDDLEDFAKITKRINGSTRTVLARYEYFKEIEDHYT